jgi:CheY-like chemotaxis protein
MVTILLAEKDLEIRQLIKSLLKREGYHVVEVRNGKEALEQYEKLPIKPELIILSSILQKKNGLDAIRQLLARDPECNILFVTGDPQIEKQELFHANVRIRTKPINTTDLLSTIHEIVQA